MQHAAMRSGESGMTAGDAEPWARLRLVQGESTAQKWELVSSLGHTTLTVGSNPECAWVVRDEGVRPIHFSLHWDGNILRVADVYSAGDVRVDGALLTSQWRPLLGRVRIDFGRAAMVVETSASASPRPELNTALETRPKAPPRGKETLIGVVGAQGVPVFGGASAAPAPAPSEVSRKDYGSMKATLVGGVGGGPAPTPASAGGPGPKPNATLVGFSVADALRGVVSPTPAVTIGSGGASGGASLNDPDQRTVQGFPRAGSAAPAAGGAASGAPSGRRATVQGVGNQLPGVDPDAVSRVPVRPISSPPGSGRPGQERIGSAWQESPESRSARGLGGSTLPGMQTPDEPASEPPRSQRAPRLDPASAWNGEGRISDIPTQMRDPSEFESHRPRRSGFPWRVVGVLVLTAVAYFAWLYLLDHI